MPLNFEGFKSELAFRNHRTSPSASEQKLLWAMARKLKKCREDVIICARAGRPVHVCLMALSRMQVLTLVCEDAGVLEDVKALIRDMDNKEARNE